ncbi:MAG: sulfite exporter TauE/SafE family protein [Acidobacteria bacterium]|nr:sulfite exporter TauE/SafE family protein [Acidobacteriota bacterium]
MKKKLYILISLLFFLFVDSASSHPLGNFSVNQYSRIEVEKAQVKLRAVLDMAEIPTFQESQTIDSDKDGSLSQNELNAFVEKITPNYIANLQLSIDGQPVELRESTKDISLPMGSGNLPTLKIKWDLIGNLPIENSNIVHQIKFENKNYVERVGWNEIVVGRVSGINIFNSTAFGTGITNELEAYPDENLNAPLTERRAEFSFTSSAIPNNAKPLQNRDGHTSAPVEKDKFAELINVPEITFPIAIAGLFLAFGFGAMHAMSPGHGKTVVGAYLVGSRGTFKHAVFLGLTVTITHTLSVFALGIVALFASNYILPERLMPFLSFVSGLLVFFIGLTLFKDRLFSALGWKTSSHHHHHHDHADGHTHHHDEHGHDHSHGEHSHNHELHSHDEHPHQHAHDGLTHTHGGSTHTHLPPENISWRNLLALGVSGGLLPCPSALVLMLSAISLNRIGYGIILTLVFSIGLAATLTAVGLVFLYVGKFFDSPGLSNNRIIKALPVFSAFVIACVGAVICYNSLM